MKRLFVNPFKEKGEWFKGNIHTHSTMSDGITPPEDLVEFYKEKGYDFLSITDHGKVTNIEELGKPELLMIPGEELCVGQTHVNTFYHIVALGIEKRLPFNDLERNLSPQKVIDHINQQGGISILAHPYWSGMNQKDMMVIRDYHGVEIYNTTCDYERNRGLSAVHIDGIITQGRRPLIFAADDHHGVKRPLIPVDAGEAWIKVKTDKLSRESIISSIQKGLFYSSTGPEIKEINIDDEGTLKLKCTPAKHITFASSPAAGRKLHAEKEPLTEAAYEGGPGESYLRIEITDYKGRTAWSNPIYNI